MSRPDLCLWRGGSGVQGRPMFVEGWVGCLDQTYVCGWMGVVSRPGPCLRMDGYGV